MKKPGIRRESRTLLWLEGFLLGLSLSLLAVWVAWLVVPAAWEWWASYTFDQEIHADAVQAEAVPEQKGDAESTVPTRRAPLAHEAIPPAELLGRLTIPRLNLMAMVREGDGESTLSLGLGHIPGTAFPGQSGNVGVAGHRDAIFRGLREIRKNDLIHLETRAGEYTYRVEEMQIVKPEEVSVLNSGKYPELTLVTCYPFYYIGSAPNRFIVKARRVSAPKANAPAISKAVSLPTI